MKVTALAGGVGGVKLAHGLAQLLPPEQLTLVVNTGDDFEHLGLKICPDLDTVCYTLAGLANPETGWGRADETWNALGSMTKLGGTTWFRLGDRDLGVHLERTRRLRAGQSLSQVTEVFCRAWGVTHLILPASDDAVPTLVYTEEGEMPFQEYFVHHQCHPKVVGFRFEAVEMSLPAPGVIKSITEADLVIICPSNPWVSIDPILAVPGIRQAIAKKSVVAVSPIIGGKAIKGPAAKMYAELGIKPSALAVCKHYHTLLSGFVLDHIDAVYSPEVQDLGIRPFVTDTIMRSNEERRRLATEVLEFGRQVLA